MTTEDWGYYSIDPSICGDTSSYSGSENYEKLPYGRYHVAIKELKLKKSKSGFPMLMCNFQVLNHPDLGGKSIYMFSLLLRDGSDRDKIFVSRCNAFLRSLRMIHESEIVLNQETGVPGYAAMVEKIFNEIQMKNPTFALDYNCVEANNGKTYDTHLIEDVYMS